MTTSLSGFIEFVRTDMGVTAAQVPDAFGKLALPSWSITLDAREWAAKKGEWLAEFERAVAK